MNAFSMDIELRNDRIPRNPFDRQFLDMMVAPMVQWCTIVRHKGH